MRRTLDPVELNALSVSSMCIWSENSHPKGEAEDGGNFRLVPVPFYCFCLRGQTRSPKEWAKISCYYFDIKNNIVVL